MKYIFITLLITQILVFKVKSQSFTNIANLDKSRYGKADWGDYDNDGDLDIIVCGMDVNWQRKTKIYRNDSNGVFTNINAPLPGVTSGGTVQWFDFDNDNWLDIIITGNDTSNSGSTYIFRNNGNNTFTNIIANMRGVYFGSTDFGDYDNDGDYDILLTGHSNNPSHISWIYKNQNGVFQRKTNTSLTGIGTGEGKWGDFNNDGNLDILLLGQFYTDLIYRNINGNFTNTNINLVNAGYDGFAADWGDYDGDGDLDIAISGDLQSSSTNSFTRILEKVDNSWTYNNINAGLTRVRNGSLDWGDADNDGDLDLIVTGRNANYNGNTSKVYRNDSTTFSSISNLAGVEGGSGKWGDFDNDGDLDILLTGNTYNTFGGLTRVYRNNSSISNSPPSSPSNLISTTDSNKVFLSWGASIDSTTLSKSLTYNLVVGDSSNLYSICSPMANLSTGKRKVVGMGNVGLDTVAELNNLPNGKYYWSVQAIDNSFEGSLFAPMDSFYIDSSLTPFQTTVIIDSNVSCYGHLNGGATASATGGMPPYSFQWSNNANTASVSGLSAGTYFVTVSDSLNSKIISKVQITEPPLIKNGQIVSSCVTFFWNQNGVTYTQSGIYNDTLQSIAGCDSIISLDLTINSPTSSSQLISACDSFIWNVNNQILTQSGVYYDTIPNNSGCDSIITLTLSIAQSTYDTTFITSCDNYTWLSNNQTYSSSGIYYDSLVNNNGCDSIQVLDLTINNSPTSTIDTSSCNSFYWNYTGLTYTQSGIYIDTVQNTVGCDSIISLDLTINTTTNNSQIISTCDSFVWNVNNQLFTQSGVYYDTIPNIAGCDSIVQLNLTIDSLNNQVLIQNDTLIAQQDSAQYQWLNCVNGMNIINGEINKKFVPSLSGLYAVALNYNSCNDTSSCVNIIITSLNENETQMNQFEFYPNPTRNYIQVTFEDTPFQKEINILDVNGSILKRELFFENKIKIDVSNFPSGLYFLNFENQYKKLIITK